MKYLKYLPWVLVILAISAVAIYQYRETVATRALLAMKNKELMEANLEIGRAKTEVLDQKKLHETALATMDERWKDEIKKRKALVSLYAELEAKYNAEKKKVKIRTRIVYRDKPGETIDLPKNKLYIRQDNGEYKEITSMQWSYKDFRITIQGDAVEESLSYELHQKFRGQIVETRLPTGGRNHYFRLYELDDKGKDVGELKLDRFEVLQSEELPNHMMWWNPKLDIGLGLGINHKADISYMADIGMSLSSYGKTANDIILRFFRFSTGFTGSGFTLNFSPVQYNIGSRLPLVSNVWIMPFGGYDFGASAATFGLGLSVVF